MQQGQQGQKVKKESLVLLELKEIPEPKELLERGEANGTVVQRLLGQAQQELFLTRAESQMHL